MSHVPPRTLFFTDAPRRGYHVVDAENEVPHGWHESGSGPAGQGTTTIGGGTTPGMKVDLVTSFPLLGARFIYVPVTDPNGDWRVFKKDMQSKNGMPEQVGGPYSAGEDAFLWSDQTSTDFRVWRTVRQRADTDDMSRAGNARSADGGLGVSSRTWENGGKNADTGEGEGSGVGAESWVGKRSNTTGYQINASDARKRRPVATTTSDSDIRRPGIVTGRAASQLVAKRANALHQMNEANRKAWS